ncbi:DUF6712 family protein [Rudanella lutea]|uniref:DUF6712 family protein n=1 Tax=Rudanella lutea TaxID=451374 RepID=UPI00036CE1A8|nr:DUF6712 family protein [Rudanella lutea]
MIINDLETLRKYLGRAINASTTLAFIEPYIQLAQDEFILPALGVEMLAELEEQAASPNTLTESNAVLLPLVQRALAFYTYQKYLPYSIGSDGDKGMQEQGTDSTKPVRMGVLDMRRRETAENAANALERVLLQLHRNPDDYPTWTGSDAYREARSLFLHSASELTLFLPQVGGSYRLFTSLRAYLAGAERDILTVVGQAQFDRLKAVLVGDETGDAPTAALLRYVKNAVARVAYAKALYFLNVVQTPGGALRILSDFDGIYNQKAVSSADLEAAQRRSDNEAAGALNSLKEFLDDNAAQYPLYSDSPAASAPAPQQFPDNSKYKGIFRMR